MKSTIKPFGIATSSCIPVRKEPGHRNEMCTQLLFGESYECLQILDNWIEIRCLFDDSLGWIHEAYYVGCDRPGLCVKNDKPHVTAQLTTVIQLDCCKNPFSLLPGSTLPVSPSLGTSFNLAGKTFKFVTPLPEEPLYEKVSNIEALALIYIHAPYLWGGRSPFGIDSSGLIQMVSKLQGRALPRTLNGQVTVGKQLSFVQDSQAGDLAFFDNEEGEIIHGGIITSPGRIMHASGEVREDQIDHAGIFDEQNNKYLYNLRVVNRL